MLCNVRKISRLHAGDMVGSLLSWPSLMGGLIFFMAANSCMAADIALFLFKNNGESPLIIFNFLY